MPVTARLSRNFYERFGDDITGELVDWFNAVDQTYQTQLKEINELNWERFKAALQGEGATIHGELRADMFGIREELRTEISATREGLRTEMSSMRLEMSAMRVELIKWMFVFWCGNMIGLGGLIVGLRIFGA